jgi:excisionase family DNA binding protein
MEDSGKAGVPVGEAARVLGVTAEAVRKRVRRGTLSAYKVGSEWRIVLDGLDVSGGVAGTASGTVAGAGDGTASGTASTAAGRMPSGTASTMADGALVDQLRGEVAFLREELARRDRIVLELMLRVPALPAPAGEGETSGRRAWWRFWRR